MLIARNHLCAVLVGVDRRVAALAFASRQDFVQTSYTLVNFKAMVFSSLALSLQRLSSRQAPKPLLPVPEMGPAISELK